MFRFLRTRTCKYVTMWAKFIQHHSAEIETIKNTHNKHFYSCLTTAEHHHHWALTIPRIHAVDNLLSTCSPEPCTIKFPNKCWFHSMVWSDEHILSKSIVDYNINIVRLWYDMRADDSIANIIRSNSNVPFNFILIQVCVSVYLLCSYSRNCCPRIPTLHA